MTDLGHPIAHTAIYKSESGKPRRAIPIDELEAYALVFDSTVDALLADPAALAERDEEIQRRFREWRMLIDSHEDVLSVMRRQREVVEDQVVELAARSGEALKKTLTYLPASGTSDEHTDQLRRRIVQARKEQRRGQPRKET